MNTPRFDAWLGDMPSLHACDPHVEVLATREYREFTEKKIAYQGNGDDVIPAYLLIPRGVELPTAGIVAYHQCGYHCDVGKEQVVGKRVDLPDQAYGFELAKQGFVVLAPDAKNVGERYNPDLREPWQCAENRADQDRCCCGPGGSWGYPRWQPVFDARRAVDVLCRQPEVDAARVGAIGHSLGADTIIWTLPFEARIRAAAISGGGIIRVKAAGWQPYAVPYAEFLAMVVATGVPFFEFAGTQDPIHRLDDPQLDDEALHMWLKREIYERLWAETEATKATLQLVTARCGHRFHEEGRRRAYQFLRGHLGDPVRA
jgi:dienelactone hydrolase